MLSVGDRFGQHFKKTNVKSGRCKIHASQIGPSLPHLPKIPIVHPPTRGLRLKVIPDWDESGELIVGTATDELKSAFSTVLMVGTAADELKMHGASPLPWG